MPIKLSRFLEAVKGLPHYLGGSKGFKSITVKTPKGRILYCFNEEEELELVKIILTKDLPKESKTLWIRREVQYA